MPLSKQELWLKHANEPMSEPGIIMENGYIWKTFAFAKMILPHLQEPHAYRAAKCTALFVFCHCAGTSQQQRPETLRQPSSRSLPP